MFGDGLGGEREQGGHVKRGLASVWARAWRGLTCSDIVVCCLFPGWDIRNLLRHRQDVSTASEGVSGTRVVWGWSRGGEGTRRTREKGSCERVGACVACADMF